MILKGKYGKAFITIEDAEQECISQVYSFLNHPAFTNDIVMLPDCHAGAGVPVGFSMRMTDKIIPNVIGVDIACGILSCKVESLKTEYINWATVDKYVRKDVPLGFNTHSTPVSTIERDFPWKSANQYAELFLKSYSEMFNVDTKNEFDKFDLTYYKSLCDRTNVDQKQVDSSIGTLGGGNHFLEFGVDNYSDQWLTIHTGSRNFGLKVATAWQKFAQSLQENKVNNKDLAYLPYPLNISYLMDMIFVQHFAQLNRHTIKNLINAALSNDIKIIETIESVHNYIDFSDMIIRKGAIRSYANEKMVIPFNMRDGILICEGRSNPEWNFSAPHGAGRAMSRTQAKKYLSLEEFKNQMTGIYSTCIDKGTLDEAPDSYKSSKMIEDAITPTAIIINKIKPLYNLKG